MSAALVGDRSWRSWVALGVAPAAWFLHLVSCLSFDFSLCGSTPASARAAALAVTAVALAISGGCLGLALVSWRSQPDRALEAFKLEPYLALAAICVAAACTLGIVWAGVPVLVLGPCGATR